MRRCVLLLLWLLLLLLVQFAPSHAVRLVRRAVAADEEWRVDWASLRISPRSLAALLTSAGECSDAVPESIAYRGLVQLAADGASVRRVGPGGAAVSLGHLIRFRAECDGVVYHCVAYRDVWRQLALVERRAPLATVADLAPRVDGVKVMCFNVFNFNEPWAQRLDAVVDRIVAAAPHVVLLQEVRFKASWVHAKAELRSSRAQIVHIVDALHRRDASVRWQFVHRPSAVYTHGGVAQMEFEGVAILSRAPIIATDHLALSRDLDDAGDCPHQRTVLRARLATADRVGAIDFFTTHFSLSERAQLRAVGELADWLDALRAADPAVPQVLGGDLNALPSAPAIQRLLGTDVGFVDTWARFLAGNETARALAADAARNYGNTFPTLGAQPAKRIDFVLVRNVDDVRVRKFEVVEDRGTQAEFSVYSLAPDNSVRETRQNQTYWASDHLALYTELELTPSSSSSREKDEL
jgi:endonuclease/exonuclease/phosphatase family metal-dependent hydrolase